MNQFHSGRILNNVVSEVENKQLGCGKWGSLLLLTESKYFVEKRPGIILFANERSASVSTTRPSFYYTVRFMKALESIRAKKRVFPFSGKPDFAITNGAILIVVI